MVGVDGSPGAERALRWALPLAERAGGSLTAVMGWEYPALAMLPAPFGVPVPPPERMEEAATAALTVVLDAIRAEASMPIEQSLLVEASSDASMLVVGARNVSGVAGALLGSVAAGVAASSPVPVVVVPTR